MLKLFKKNTFSETPESALLQDLKQSKSALDLAYSKFENVIEPDLIDCCIYEVNAAQKRYTFLLERIKQIQ